MLQVKWYELSKVYTEKQIINKTWALNSSQWKKVSGRVGEQMRKNKST